jgi:tRNA(Ile2) C34 agmatinyltransferase TiaS
MDPTTISEPIAEPAEAVKCELSTVCPDCGVDMSPEHAHYRCPSCGYRDSCCF